MGGKEGGRILKTIVSQFFTSFTVSTTSAFHIVNAQMFWHLSMVQKKKKITRHYDLAH